MMTIQAWKRFVCAAAPVLLAGCVSLLPKARPIAVDMPMPAGAEDALCARVHGQLRSLGPDDPACYAPVVASEWLTRVPLQVRPGERYCVRVAGRQLWYDDANAVTAPRGFKGSVLMNSLRLLRRQDADWFALYGAVVDADPDGRKEHEYASFNLESPAVITVPSSLSGTTPLQLAFYPNDAYGFYFNNHGQIWLTIARCASDAACCDARQP